MIWSLVAGLSISGALFVGALVLIIRAPGRVSDPTPEYSDKYLNPPMTQEEIEYYNKARWD